MTLWKSLVVAHDFSTVYLINWVAFYFTFLHDNKFILKLFLDMTKPRKNLCVPLIG